MIETYSDALSLINSYYGDQAELLQKKADAFDRIAKLFYFRNFGTANKSDIELLMFDFLLNVLIENNTDNDNVLDYNECSDYYIAKLLGITQEKVRNLKVKKQARQLSGWNGAERNGIRIIGGGVMPAQDRG